MTFLSDDVLFCMEKIGFGQFWKRKGLTFPVTRALTSYTHVAYSYYHQKPYKLLWVVFWLITLGEHLDSVSCSFPCRLFVSGARVKVVRAFASYQWGPGSNREVDDVCGLKLLLVLPFTRRGFFLGTLVFLPLPKLTLPNSISTRNGRRRTKMWMCYL